MLLVMRCGATTAGGDTAGNQVGAKPAESPDEDSADALLPAKLVTAVAYDCVHRLFSANNATSSVSKLLLRCVLGWIVVVENQRDCWRKRHI